MFAHLFASRFASLSCDCVPRVCFASLSCEFFVVDLHRKVCFGRMFWKVRLEVLFGRFVWMFRLEVLFGSFVWMCCLYVLVGRVFLFVCWKCVWMVDFELGVGSLLNV